MQRTATLIVELNHEGEKGYGESMAILYYNVTVDQMIDQLKKNNSVVGIS